MTVIMVVIMTAIIVMRSTISKEGGGNNNLSFCLESYTNIGMEAINDYFKTLVFTRMNVKQMYTSYVAVIHSYLGGSKKRYVIAFVPEHLSIKNTSYLKSLMWVNLQLRELDESAYPSLNAQEWTAPLKTNLLGDLMMNVTERKPAYSTYRAQGFSYEVLLMNNSKITSLYQYPNSANIHYLINQFNTIFNKLPEVHGPEPQIITPIHIRDTPRHSQSRIHGANSSTSSDPHDDVFELI